MADSRRRLLNLLAPAPVHGNRSSLTCRFKCGDACFHEVPNTSENEYLGDIIDSVISRRGLMKVGVVAAGAAAVAGSGAAAFVNAPKAAALDTKGSLPGLGWTPIAPARTDAVEVPAGFAQDIVIRWGDPILAGAPEFDPYNQTAAKQAGQFGYNCDYLGFFPLDKQHEVMVVNHEYTDEVIMFPGYDAANPTREQVEIAWAAHGLSVVVVKKNQGNGKLKPVVGHRLNRRYTATTPFEVTGPVRGSDYLKTSADATGYRVLGTLNNCAGGNTPWGTVLSGEENFNQYFANGSRPGWAPAAGHQPLRHPDRGVRAQVGAVRRPLRPLARAQRGPAPGLGRRDRPVRPDLHAEEALHARPDQARGRHLGHRQGRPRGRLLR